VRTFAGLLVLEKKMGKTLIIAEKPSVARDLAAALGGFTKNADGALESDAVIISSAVGHLLKLSLPEGVDKGWDLAVLPVIPPNFNLSPIPKTESQLKLLGRMLRRPNIDFVVNACDAGREGELIFRYIYLALGCRLPMKRMWLQSMTPDAMRDSFHNMMDGREKESLFHAAQCRSEADWLIGINTTRALTKLRDLQVSNDGVASAGRVQSPTLAIICDREWAILGFVPRDFWEVRGTFRLASGTYDGKWSDPFFKKIDGDDVKRADRLFDHSKALEIEARCRGINPSLVADESKPTSSSPPKLFDLTGLQREANKKFGFSAKNTLDIAQVLYERHKVLTYPRTASTALPEDYIETVKKTLSSLAGTPMGDHAARVLTNNWVKPDKRIFNNAKITDHFAIIPNGQRPSGLSPDEAKIYDLVTRRFVAAFHPAAQYLQTTRTTTVGIDQFMASGSVLVSEGWLQVYGRDVSEPDTKSLCKLITGEPAATEGIKLVGLKTSPPERFTEATLLGAMESAGKLIDDEDLRDAMKESGLGTPATRAATIEELLSVDKQYLFRDKKYLVPSQKGLDIIKLMRTNNIEILTSPQLTGEWEKKLLLMEQGKYTRAAFMSEVKETTQRIVEIIRQKAGTIPQPEAKPIDAPCPKCSGTVVDKGKTYACSACDFKIWREIAGRTLSQAEAESLLRDKVTAKLDGFLSKSKTKFSTRLKLSAGFDKVEFDFEPVAPPAGERKAVGACPKCASAVIVAGDNYACEKSFATPKSCDFRLWGTVASLKVKESDISLLLAERRTGLIEGFRSKAKRPFSAHLALKSNHEVGFEFEDKA
jgi:DNA topoisomerase-3